MIILTAGHTGANSGAQCATTYFDEGAENIWLRNRIAEILTNKYGLVVLIDNDTASLQLLTKALNQVGTHGSCVLSVARPNKSNPILISSCQNQTSKASTTVDHRPLTVDDVLIDLHFNAHSNPNARGTEAIVSDDATTIELRFATRLAHATAEALEIPLRSIKSETQTPHHRLAMLHLTPQSIILEICFCTSPDDVKQYRQHREHLANTLAKNIALLLDKKTR